jgi:predicted anti-sigma-YlaC factor YlaD
MIDQTVDEALGTKSLSVASSAITHHISDEDLERHLLGTMKGVELEMIEEHLLWCEICIWYGRKSEDYVNSMRAALAECSGALVVEGDLQIGGHTVQALRKNRKAVLKLRHLTPALVEIN